MSPTIKAIFNTVFPVICWLFCAINSSKLAYKKNRDTQTWFLLGLFFGIVALAIIYFLKPLKNLKKNTQRISTKPLINHFTVLKNDNNYWYYLDKERKQIGPMSLEKLYDFYLKEKISNYTYVWNDTMDNWKKLTEISSLSKILKKSTS
ncbi:MAG: hypothetical protein KR126chlam4_01153 [Candidatus Anoxychlamydiales bacterium]|nr:hypothetical protein [Candidatus Anoxychlamydiales bacterium]HEU64550.1 DUF4339 domain-containing protein [Chlamydiota bacterium]